MYHHNSFKAHQRVLWLKAAEVLFMTILISVSRFIVKSLEKVVLLVKKEQKFVEYFTITRFKPHLPVLGLKAGQVLFLCILISLFAFQCQQSHESATFGQKRQKVCELSHHNSF